MLEKDRAGIQECLYAIEGIQTFTQDKLTLDSLVEDRKTYDAVLMNFIVLGSSAGKLSDDVKAKLLNVDWRAINGFRNFVAHEYFGVDENVLWSAIQFHLPNLKEDFKKLLEEDTK